MKKTLCALIIYNLVFPLNIFAQTANDAETLNIVSGTQRYELLSDSAVTLEDPNGVQALGEPANSLSIPMSAANDVQLAANLSANEAESSERSEEIATRCSDEALEKLSADSNLQLYSLSCRVYEYVNSITGYFSEADQLEKQLIDNKATLNQAQAENAYRNAQIAKEKEKMNAANKEIKSAIAKIDADKKAVEAAQKAVEAAQKALEAANAIECGEDEDGSCSAGKAAAVAAATTALATATAKLDAAKAKLDKSVAKLIDLLVNKLGLETSAVLTILSGTAVGDADGTSVNFQVNGGDYSLVNLNTLLADGSAEGNTNRFVDSRYSSEATRDYFTGFVENARENQEDGEATNGTSTNPYGNTQSQESTTTKEILNSFANGSLENILTLATAISDYTNDRSSKLIEQYEGMKTPESRIGAMQQKSEDLTKQLDDMKKMINLAIEQLDKTLVVFKGSFKLTRPAATSEAAKKDEIFYKYINAFVTDKLKQKAQEGYFSKVDYKAIQIQLSCFVKGGDEDSCKAPTVVSDPIPGTTGGSCHWSGPVVGPPNPPTQICSRNNIGQVLSGQDVGGTLTCKCD